MYKNSGLLFASPYPEDITAIIATTIIPAFLLINCGIFSLFIIFIISFTELKIPNSTAITIIGNTIDMYLIFINGAIFAITHINMAIGKHIKSAISFLFELIILLVNIAIKIPITIYPKASGILNP